MARYIDAEALIKSIGCYDPVKWTHEYGKVVKLDDIENAPTADVRPNVGGEWIKCSDTAFYWKCSECGSYLFWRKEEYLLREEDSPNFCPNCGAEMLSGADMRKGESSGQ